MAQDFWASSGYNLCTKDDRGWLIPSDKYLQLVLARPELSPVEESCAAERALYRRLQSKPRLNVTEVDLAELADDDARDNWRVYLEFRQLLNDSKTLEAAYLHQVRNDVTIAPVLFDQLAHSITRNALHGVEDAYTCRAAELFFREQRVAMHEGQALSADTLTIELYEETGGFGNLGRLMRDQGTQTAAIKMDVLNNENAPFYWMRDELHSFAIDLIPGREGSEALARVIERWYAHLLGLRVAVTPKVQIEDPAWRWHIGLDVRATQLLNSLYDGKALEEKDANAIICLFELTETVGHDTKSTREPLKIYLAVAHDHQQRLKLKPQNLIVGLPAELLTR